MSDTEASLVQRLREPVKAMPSGTYTIGHEPSLAWQAATAIEQLTAENAALLQDARRYRQIRKAPASCGFRDWLYMPHTEDFDAAVDDAIATDAALFSLQQKPE